jgi:flavin reductase (DIM6/NTAB) family NADH-FMN oxidoreductase RutF
MTDTQPPKRWRRAAELPEEVFAILRKPNRAINPVAIASTVGEDGAPHTAPFGSLRAVTPKLLRLISARYHDTYKNMARDGRVMIAVVAAPDIAVSIRGRARVVREQMVASEESALVEIDVEEVKNDMVRSGLIESGIGFKPLAQLQEWFDSVIGEAEDF